MNVEAKLRKMARSSYWQNVYRASKSGSGLQLFENVTNISGLQNRFLYWLAIYDSLYDNLSRFENDNLSENVIEDDIRTDAYLYYRRKKNEQEWKKYNKDKNPPKSTHRGNKKNQTTFNVDMRRS